LSVPVRRPDVHAVSKVNSSKVSNVVRIVRRRTPPWPSVTRLL
jgi:hypothetical protein